MCSTISLYISLLIFFTYYQTNFKADYVYQLKIQSR